MDIVGGVLLPSLAILALLLVPFIDRDRMVKLSKRVFAMSFAGLAIIGWAGLTATAVATTPKPEIATVDFSGPTDWMELTPEELAGIGYLRAEDCATCHTVGGGKPKIGPDLAAMT